MIPVVMAMLLGSATAPALTERAQHDVRCAAAIAVTAAAQARGDSAALALPPLGIRGKHYFGLIAEQVAAQAGLSQVAMRDILAAAAGRVTHEGATAVARSCLAELDSVVPPRPAPDALDCLALLGIYADVLAARAPPDPLGVLLRQQAETLRPAVQALLDARGIDRPSQAQAIDRAQTALRAALDSVDAEQFGQCRKMAAAKTG